MDAASRAARKAAKEAEEWEKKRQGSVVGEGISVVWQEKLPGGGVKRVVEAHAVTGRLNAKTRASLLNQASGTLYKENVARAHFKAPVVKGDEAKHIVEATGGVTVTSIEPTGVTVTSDRLIWYANEDKIIAEGEVKFQKTRPGETSLWAWGGPFDRVTFNTTLNQWVIQ